MWSCNRRFVSTSQPGADLQSIQKQEIRPTAALSVAQRTVPGIGDRHFPSDRMSENHISLSFSLPCRLIFGTLYPAYYSYKAVKSKDIKEYVSSTLEWGKLGVNWWEKVGAL